MTTHGTFPRTPEELRAFVEQCVRRYLEDELRAAIAPPTLRTHGLFAGDVTPGEFEELPVWARQEETGRP